MTYTMNKRNKVMEVYWVSHFEENPEPTFTSLHSAEDGKMLGSLLQYIVKKGVVVLFSVGSIFITNYFGTLPPKHIRIKMRKRGYYVGWKVGSICFSDGEFVKLSNIIIKGTFIISEKPNVEYYT